MTRQAAWLIGVLAALILGLQTSRNLEGQGAYYDELHQAPAAFFYTGASPILFTYKGPFDVPLLNMSYSGAIKSHVYGAYLRAANAPFTLRSWRLVGILFVAAGLVLFFPIAREALSPMSAIAFAALFLTDASVLLTTRHDWGPVALSLALRVVLVALLIRIAISRARPALIFLAGAIVGVAIFEKLSSVVLLAPFCLLLYSSWKISRTNAMFAVAGLALGLLPLAAMNAAYFAMNRQLISLAAVSVAAPAGGAANFVREFITLASGTGAENFILGTTIGSSQEVIEGALLTAVLVCVAIGSFIGRDTHVRLAGMMVMTYLGIAVLLLLLPQTTYIHHWILGTPFQYAAIALALHASLPRGLRVVLAGIVLVLLMSRVPNVMWLHSALGTTETSTGFDPAFTRVGQLAARESRSSVVISADWGTATQVYSFGQGERDLGYEPYWTADPRRETLRIAETTDKANVYVLTTGLISRFEAAARAVGDAMAAAPGWREEPPGPDFQDLGPIQVRKFVRTNR